MCVCMCGVSMLVYLCVCLCIWVCVCTNMCGCDCIVLMVTLLEDGSRRGGGHDSGRVDICTYPEHLHRLKDASNVLAQGSDKYLKTELQAKNIATGVKLRDFEADTAVPSVGKGSMCWAHICVGKGSLCWAHICGTEGRC